MVVSVIFLARYTILKGYGNQAFARPVDLCTSSIPMIPPIAKRVATKRSAHGHEWLDYYAWLRAPHWQDCIDDPATLPDDIKDYLLAENAWFDLNMADTLPLQNKLVVEMQARMQDVDTQLPDVEGDWAYVERFNAGDEFASYWRYPRAVQEPKQIEKQSVLLIDFNEVAKGCEYCEPGDVEYSPDHTHLVWSADTVGSERYRAVVRKLASMTDEEVIDDVSSICWGDASHLFYSRVGSDFRANRIYRHTLGTDASNDVLIYEEPDIRFSCSVWKSLSGEYMFISSDTDDQSEVWFISTTDITAQMQLLEPRTPGLEYSVEHQGDRFLILTNADDAIDFKLVEAPCDNPSRANWKELLPHRSGTMILDVFAYQDWVMWLERKDALPAICYCHSTSEIAADAIQEIGFEQEAYAISLQPLLEFNEQVFRFEYESPSTPTQTYAFDMTTGQRQLLKVQEVPSGHDANDYIVRRVQALSHDGVQVPVTLIHHRETPIDGTAPCWLSAYGAYGSSWPASFELERLSLLDRGFVVAIAHVRGGQERGRAWYDAARGAGKINSFDDVIAAAQCLIEKQMTSPGQLVLEGASAGGLLVAAVINRCSDLWGAAIADVPFVDALNTLMDDSLPLTPGEWAQWGNPKDDAEAFDYIRNYSPYENVNKSIYPPLLVTAGVSDPRVTWWEAAKWVAQHRHRRSDDQPLLLKTRLDSGHFGEVGRYSSLRDIAMQQAFAIKSLGLPVS